MALGLEGHIIAKTDAYLLTLKNCIYDPHILHQPAWGRMMIGACGRRKPGHLGWTKGILQANQSSSKGK
jgi:hypothetical protein